VHRKQRRQIEINIYWKERKLYQKVKMKSILEKLVGAEGVDGSNSADKSCSTLIWWGPRVPAEERANKTIKSNSTVGCALLFAVTAHLSCYRTTMTILSVNRMKPCELAVSLAFKLIIVSWNVALS
jgi:hypothetical protein